MKWGNQFLSLYFVWLEKAMEENLLSGRWRPIQFQIQIPSKKEEANPISQKKKQILSLSKKEANQISEKISF